MPVLLRPHCSLRLQAALASTLMSQGQSTAVHGDIFSQLGPSNDNFGLPNTNLSRMSADAIMGSSYFTHQLGRASADGGLDPPFQYSALSRRSADASLPVGRNLPQRYTALPLLLSACMPHNSDLTICTLHGIPSPVLS